MTHLWRTLGAERSLLVGKLPLLTGGSPFERGLQRPVACPTCPSKWVGQAAPLPRAPTRLVADGPRPHQKNP